MLDRLSDRLKLLTGGARDQPARHRTLRDTLAWSHELLDDEEQDLFAGLSIFAGQFGLDAAEAVCGADLDVLGIARRPQPRSPRWRALRDARHRPRVCRRTTR